MPMPSFAMALFIRQTAATLPISAININPGCFSLWMAFLARQAEKTIADNFAAVKKADIQLQTTLGNRKGQIAANIIGAFAESQNSAFGWQVRAFGAENDTKGANAGIFFRRLDGESLYGINSFADYEDRK